VWKTCPYLLHQSTTDKSYGENQIQTDKDSVKKEFRKLYHERNKAIMQRILNEETSSGNTVLTFVEEHSTASLHNIIIIIIIKAICNMQDNSMSSWYESLSKYTGHYY